MAAVAGAPWACPLQTTLRLRPCTPAPFDWYQRLLWLSPPTSLRRRTWCSFHQPLRMRRGWGRCCLHVALSNGSFSLCPPCGTFCPLQGRRSLARPRRSFLMPCVLLCYPCPHMPQGGPFFAWQACVWQMSGKSPACAFFCGARLPSFPFFPPPRVTLTPTSPPLSLPAPASLSAASA